MRKLVVAAMALFFAVTGVFVVWENYHKPRLMVLHSYGTDYVWTQEINEGLKRVLGKNHWLSVRYHYMHTNLFHSQDELRRASLAARRAVEQFHPDVLLAIDDHAQDLVGRFYVNDPRLKVVFAGVNGEITPYGYDDKAKNVTGIMEHKQFKPVQEMLTNLWGDQGRPPRVAHLSDMSMASTTDTAEADKFAWAPQAYVGGFKVADFIAWKKKALELSGQVDFLLVSGYRQLPYGGGKKEFAPPDEVIAWTLANVEVPVVGLNAFNSRDGAMISLGVSPYEQGQVSAQMAIDILNGSKKIADLPIRPASQYVISMSQQALARYRIKPPQVFEAFARATNNFFK
ncbi:MAG: hypothetical protein HGA96_10640 [Desulfobulbaceae bacterium]|nr:hypothetical protein [Desulfobulbaceae bacterium]